MKIFFYIFAFFYLGQGHAEIINMAVTNFGQPPFHIRPKSGDIISEGIVVEFLTAFQKEYPQYQITIRGLPRIRQELALDNGTADMTYNSPTFLGDKASKFLWSNPFARSRDCIVSLKEKKFIFKNPHDLFYKEIGIIRGYGYGDYDKYFAEKKIRGLAVTESLQLIKMLKSKRIDAFIGNSYVTPYDIKSLNENIDLFHFSSKSLYEFEFMFQINKKKIQLKRDLDQFIIKAQKDHLIEHLKEKIESSSL